MKKPQFDFILCGVRLLKGAITGATGGAGAGQLFVGEGLNGALIGAVAGAFGALAVDLDTYTKAREAWDSQT